jgi:hypothetical protein
MIRTDMAIQNNVERPAFLRIATPLEVRDDDAKAPASELLCDFVTDFEV